MQDRDFDFFIQNMPDFYTTYGHKFLAIKNLSVIGTYSSFDEALDKTLKTEELGSFLIQECFNNVDEMVNHFQGEGGI